MDSAVTIRLLRLQLEIEHERLRRWEESEIISAKDGPTNSRVWRDAVGESMGLLENAGSVLMRFTPDKPGSWAKTKAALRVQADLKTAQSCIETSSAIIDKLYSVFPLPNPREELHIRLLDEQLHQVLANQTRVLDLLRDRNLQVVDDNFIRALPDETDRKAKQLRYAIDSVSVDVVRTSNSLKGIYASCVEAVESLTYFGDDELLRNIAGRLKLWGAGLFDGPGPIDIVLQARTKELEYIRQAIQRCLASILLLEERMIRDRIALQKDGHLEKIHIRVMAKLKADVFAENSTDLFGTSSAPTLIDDEDAEVAPKNLDILSRHVESLFDFLPILVHERQLFQTQHVEHSFSSRTPKIEYSEEYEIVKRSLERSDEQAETPGPRPVMALQFVKQADRLFKSLEPTGDRARDGNLRATRKSFETLIRSFAATTLNQTTEDEDPGNDSNNLSRDGDNSTNRAASAEPRSDFVYGMSKERVDELFRIMDSLEADVRAADGDTDWKAPKKSLLPDPTGDSGIADMNIFL